MKALGVSRGCCANRLMNRCHSLPRSGCTTVLVRVLFFLKKPSRANTSFFTIRSPDRIHEHTGWIHEQLMNTFCS